jgi:hypothetical protein
MTMFVPGLARGLGLIGLAVLLAAPAGHAQEKVYRHVSSDKLEGILKDLSIAPKKTADKQEGVFFYEFERSNYKIRLHNYNGKDLWIDTVFGDQGTLKLVNGWNVQAKFSRAVLLKAGNTSSISLESQIDCLGGVTDGMVRQFINRFDGEIKQFAKYLGK